MTPKERNQQIFRLMEDLLSEVRIFAEEIEAAGEAEVAELIMAARQVSTTAREAKTLADQAVLAWFEENRQSVRSITIGDLKYFGTVSKSTKCRDVGDAWEALMEAQVQEAFLRATGGDLTAWEEIKGQLVGLFRVVVSSNGLKQGTVKGYLGAEIFAEHFETVYPKSVKGQPAEKSLGVANLRFVTGRPEASAKELKDAL